MASPARTWCPRHATGGGDNLTAAPGSVDADVTVGITPLTAADLVFLLEPDVDGFGYLTGGDKAISTNTALHDWRTPYPVIAETLSFTWAPGDLGRKPEVFAHNLLRDLVLAPAALRVLREVAPGDIRVIAHGVLDAQQLVVVQATSVLDVVDLARSVRGPDPDVVDFPRIPAEREAELARRLFRVPNKGQTLSVYAGDELKQAWEVNDVRGLNYLRVVTQE